MTGLQAAKIKNPVYRWFSSVGRFYRFVHFRRVDRSAGILPGGPVLPVVLALGIATVMLAHFYADDDFMAWLNAGMPQTYRLGFFGRITHLGSTNWILAISGGVVILLSVFPEQLSASGKFQVWHRRFMSAYYFFTTIVFSGLLVLLLKNLIGRARPQATEAGRIWHSAPFEGHYHFASFPSGHSTTAGAIAFMAVLLFPRLGWGVVPVCILVAMSRVMIGVHFPSDAMAGFLLGALFAWLYARSFARKRLLVAFDGKGSLIHREPLSGKLVA